MFVWATYPELSVVSLKPHNWVTHSTTATLFSALTYFSTLTLCFHSGLDSSSSLQVIQHLGQLACRGHTVVVTLHQPSSRLLELVDDVLVMANGQTLYNGPLDSMVETFRSAGFECPHYYNRADFGKSPFCSICTYNRSSSWYEYNK